MESKKVNCYFKTIIKNNKGQMLLFVLVVVLLLLLIVLAIITNVRVDIKETQMEREYETGYSIAEGELFKISANGYPEDGSYLPLTGDESNFCPQAGCDEEQWQCTKKTGLGEDANSTVIVKRCEHHSINNMTIDQDQTLEAYVRGATGNLSLTWETAPAMSIMLICKNSITGDYKNVRAAVCRPGISTPKCGMNTTPDAGGFITTSQAQVDPNHDHPLNMSGCATGFTPELLRLRAIGGQATNVFLSGTNLPPQMEEIRVQSFTEGTGEGVAEDLQNLSAPEVVTVSMIRKRVPALFDYVLFVANGDVSK